MAKEFLHTPESDLDRTDKLPILEGTQFDHDVEDDAVRMETTGVLPVPLAPAPGVAADFARSTGVDLPSLAESVRSVEERIARQSAEFEALTRAYDRAQDTASAMAERANALAADLTAARAALESEQRRSRQLDELLAERGGAAEAARSRVEEALRESERHQSEARTLRDALAARDAGIAQALRSLGERDAQLAALQAEHARIVPVLEATSKSTTQLDAELQTARARAEGLAAELRASRASAAELALKVERGEAALSAARTELSAARTQASGYLDLLRTREWRRGFDQNLFREMDAQVGAASAGHGALESERDRLQSRVAELQAQLAAQTDAVGQLQTTASASAAALGQKADDLRRAEEARAQLSSRLAAAEAEAARLNTSLALQTKEAAQLAQVRGEQAAQLVRLQSEARARDQEMSVLMAHLQEARRPIQSIEADVRRLTEELAAKNTAAGQLAEENSRLRASLERTRGALEEREFLIRRLERSESNNANVLGRIQTSIERLGSVAVGPVAATAAADWSAELIRVDGEHPVSHVLSRRTRIGRAAGCELQVESTSVSRHHALVLVGPREAIIEDLNSTNGVLVNGRKITRHLLSDGDAVTIGEIQFRYVVRPQTRAAEAGPATP